MIIVTHCHVTQELRLTDVVHRRVVVRGVLPSVQNMLKIKEVYILYLHVYRLSVRKWYTVLVQEQLLFVLVLYVRSSIIIYNIRVLFFAINS